MINKVVIRKVEKIYEDLKEAIDLLGGFKIIDDDFVVIKPNLCDFRPSWEGSTTDPKIVEAFIKIIRENANPRIAIVESDHAIASADEEFERMGYKDLAESLGVELINLSKDKRYNVVLNGHYFETLEVPETLLKATKIVSIAKLKTHAQQKITCNMKNLFGLLPRKSKAKYHSFMNEVLADLNEYYKPTLCIIDGIVGMEGFGPSDGDKKNTGIIIIGTNPINTDSIAAKLMGFNPHSIPNLKYAEKAKLGCIDKIEVVSNIDMNSISKFKFIPIYSYSSYRISFFLMRVNYKFNKVFMDISDFISQLGVGFLVLIQGYLFIPSFGVLYRKDAFRYARGLIYRVFTILQMKMGGLI